MSLLTPPSSGILTSFSPIYFQFCQKCHSDLISKSTYESYSIGLKKMHAIWKKKKDLTSPDPHCLFQVELAKGRPSWPHCILPLTTLAYPQTDALILQNTENSSSLTSHKAFHVLPPATLVLTLHPLHTPGTHVSSITESSKPFHDYMSMILIYVSINVPNMLYCN